MNPSKLNEKMHHIVRSIIKNIIFTFAFLIYALSLSISSISNVFVDISVLDNI